MVLEITLSMFSCSQWNDCGTGDNSFNVIMFIEE